MPTTGKVALDKLRAANEAQDNELAQIAEGEAGIEAFAVDGPLTKTSGVKVLTKAGVGAYTLGAPAAADAGRRITIINGTANAHVVTATNLIDDGVTGGAKDTMTFGAFVGASIELIAYNLKWVVLAKNVVTVAGA